MCYSQSTPFKVKYGQVNQSAVSDTAKAANVKAMAHHHHMYRLLRRMMRRRKKNRKASLTGNITPHISVAAAFCSFEVSGIVLSKLDSA